MIIIAGLTMLVLSIIFQINNGASSEELFFTLVMVLFITMAVNSSVNRIRISDAKKSSRRLTKEYLEARKKSRGI